MDKWRPFCLLIAGATLSVLGRLLLPCAGWWILSGLSILCIVTFLIGTGIRPLILHRTKLCLRRNFPKNFVWGKRKVGILNDLEWELIGKKIAANTTVSPEEWKKMIRDQGEADGVKLKVKMVTLKRSLDSFHIILNPYGEAYPEYDVIKYKAFEKIFDYVNEGGVFVNVAGIAGYYFYNPFLKSRLDATKPIYGPVINFFRPFAEVPFAKRLGLQIYNVDPWRWGKVDCDGLGDEAISKDLSKMGKIAIHRVTLIERNVTAMVRIDQHHEYTPVFTIPYGQGTFLMSLVFLGDEENRFKELVTKCLFSFIRGTMLRSSKK